MFFKEDKPEGWEVVQWQNTWVVQNLSSSSSTGKTKKKKKEKKEEKRRR